VAEVEGRRPPRLAFVPFVAGRRPSDEARHPGLGSSDAVAFVTGDPDGDNVATLLFDLEGVTGEGWHVDAALRFGDERRRLDVDVDVVSGGPRRHSLDVRPDRDLADLDLGFGAGFLRPVVVELVLRQGRRTIARDAAVLEVSDVRSLGSLYRRIVDELVAPDAAEQARSARVEGVDTAYHPWFPVLQIGMDKAALYTAALVADAVRKERHLTDPGWLLRVGVNLELLTCLGIVEAVRDDVGDLLRPAEREAFESSDVFLEIRRRIDRDAWGHVWSLRRIAFAGGLVPRTGPVSVQNLLRKRRAVLAFLHAHHEDLKHAIELAGPNDHNAQETWQRVFRDAERAVLRQTAAAFPELAFLPGPVRDRVLWQRVGVGTQEGMYPTAGNQYRASMNMVAAWAKARGLMDFTGAECIPSSASLLEAHGDRRRVARLQQHDGLGPRLEVPEPVVTADPTILEIALLLAEVPILSMLASAELQQLAFAIRPLLLAPGERVIVQGHEGTSMFAVADGTVEIVVRRDDGVDVVVDRRGRGELVGEMTLLSGEPRSATVRAVDAAVVYEIGREQYEPLLRAHPELLDELAAVMADRLARRPALYRSTEVSFDAAVGWVRDRLVARLLRS
jgi:hypothetical protein